MCNTLRMIEVFDRALLRHRRQRAAAQIDRHRFLFDAGSVRLLDRLLDIRRQFEDILILGGQEGSLARQLAGQHPRIRLLQTESSPALARLAAAAAPVIVTEEDALPLMPASFDLALSNLCLHWVNDLPGALLQLRTLLRPDGLLLASLLGGETLTEFRSCLMDAELEKCSGAGLRFSPLVDIRDAGGLLQRAGFALPTLDREILTVSYRDPMRLLQDLRGMGASNATLNRSRRPLRRDVLDRALALYRQRFASADGSVTASFEIITLTAWTPHASQPQALARGSGRIPLQQALNPEKQG